MMNDELPMSQVDSVLVRLCGHKVWHKAKDQFCLYCATDVLVGTRVPIGRLSIVSFIVPPHADTVM